MKIKLGETELVVDRTAQNQEWSKRLVIVASPPTRWVGILPPEEEQAALMNQPFWLYAAITYFCNITVQPALDGVHLGTMPQALIGYDLIEPVQRVRVTPTHWFFAHEQGDRMKKFFVDGYLSVFDPPRIVPPPVSV
jgi:hypothetical protein